MKRSGLLPIKNQWLVFLVLIFFSLPSFAQNVDSAGYFPPPPQSGGVPRLLRAQRSFIFIDITQNTWFKLPEGIETKFISGGFNFNLFYEIPVVKNVFAIAPGISFSNTTVKSNAYLQFRTTIAGEVDSTWLVPDTANNFDKSKISADFFDIPLEFRFRIRADERGKNFWIAPGFRIGFLISDFEKIIYNNQVAFQKAKLYDIPYIENFHYGISLRAGYYKFGVYTYYSLSTLFEKDRGPDLVPFSVGITVTPF